MKSRLRPLLLAFATIVWLLHADRAAAHVERFAVIIGNDRGAHDEERLRYAASDARRVQETLLALGGFDAVNTTLLVESDAQTVRRSLIAVNDRIRSAQELSGAEVMLFVYFPATPTAPPCTWGLRASR